MENSEEFGKIFQKRLDGWKFSRRISGIWSSGMSLETPQTVTSIKGETS